MTDAAGAVAPLFDALLGPDVPIRFELWDGSVIERAAPVATLKVLAPDALRRVLWMPNELGLARAYVSGDLDLDGDIFAAVEAFRAALHSQSPAARAKVAWAALRVTR